MPEWGEFWRLMVFALAIPMVLMAGVWLLARILNNAGIVDIFWSYGFIPVVAVCAVVEALAAGMPAICWPIEFHAAVRCSGVMA